MLRPLRIHITHLPLWFVAGFLIVLPEIVSAQPVPRTIVRGRILDDSTRAPLPLANVFLSNSTIGTATNVHGRFELKGVPLGSQQLVASIVGYKPWSVTLNLIDTSAKEIEIRLRPSPVQMAPVEVEEKDPVEWKKNLERFIGAFFGSTSNASKCRLLNPEVLDFNVIEEDQLTATAREPIEFDNYALGYRIQCVLVQFIQSPRLFQYAGLTQFRPLPPKNKDDEEEWKANRREAYYGSRRHFLASLVTKSAEKEGFEVNSIKWESINLALRRSTGYKVNPDTLLAPAELPFERKLSFPGLLQIIYTHNHIAFISLLELQGATATIYTSGLNPPGIWSYGYWSNQRAAEMLPMDYEPE